MGKVYRARMQGPGDASKQVALKVMHGHLAEDKDFVLMFLDEMRVAMGLNHRNIVHTFDAGKIEEDYFMVMELVDGGSLRKLLGTCGDEVPLPLDVALFIGMEVSAALEYAHRFRPEGSPRAGVLHRDVSPSNVLLSGEGDVKLADFGVAKAAGGRHVTAAHLVRGKLQYMAPEQARGEPGATSDLYSLGAVMYELVTGKAIPRPSAFEGLKQSTLPPAPSSLRPDLPSALDTLILRCLEPDPARRLGSASKLRTELAAVSFELQQRAGVNLDLHHRLRGFLVEAGMIGNEAPQATGQQAGRLAMAVLAEVREMETNSDLHPTGAQEGASTAAASSGDLTATAPLRTPPPTVGLHDAATAIEVSKAPQVVKERGAAPGPTATIAAQDRPEATSPPSGAASGRTGPRVVRLAVAALLLTASSIGVWLALDSRSPSPAAAPPVAPDISSGAVAAPMPGSPAAAASRTLDAAPPATTVEDHGIDSPAAALDAPRRRTPRPAGTRGYGQLDINSLPWAKVYIDGRYRGETPLQRLRLRAGLHTVRLVSPRSGRSQTFKARVVAGKRRARVFTLNPGQSE